MRLLTTAAAFAVNFGVAWAAPISYTVTPLQPLPGTAFAVALGLNDLGQAAGYSETAQGTEYATIWNSSGVPTALPLPSGAVSSLALAINNQGAVAGQVVVSQRFPVLWSNGTFTQLSSFGTAAAINNQGQVAGFTFFLGGLVEGALWSNGSVTDLGPLPGGLESGATGINGNSQVVGYSDVFSTEHAVLWSNGIKPTSARSLDIFTALPGASTMTDKWWVGPITPHPVALKPGTHFCGATEPYPILGH